MFSNFLKKLFKPSSSKEARLYTEQVSAINQYYESLQALSNDQLRAEVHTIRKEIADFLKPLDDQIEKISHDPSYQQPTKTDIEDFIKNKQDQDHQLQILEQKRKIALRDILDQVMVRTFAIVKETARRFKENQQLVVTATAHDIALASVKSYVSINANQAVWENSWPVSGNIMIWDMVHYDVQLMGGITLHQGKIAEMATGEGKTLITTLAAFLNALSNKSVHIVTVNDYLAMRDAEWMAPIFEFHGFAVDCIDRYPAYSLERQQAYRADIVYGTNNEFGFDYLRDNMASSLDEIVQQAHYFAIVDEVDSVLIDDARTPLIISGPVAENDEMVYKELKPQVESLYKLQKDMVVSFLQEAKQKIKQGDLEEGGLALFRTYRGLPKYKPLIKFLSENGIKQILNEVESYYIREDSRMMPEADEPLFFTIDERQNHVEITEKGLQYLAKQAKDPDFFVLPDIAICIDKIEKCSDLSQEEIIQKRNSFYENYTIKTKRLHVLSQLLKAYTLFTKDIDYIVINQKVKIVDEQTGRILQGRRYSDGLHQALEAKENVRIERPSQTYASITLQNYFHMYDKLAGMTGTAETDAEEFLDIYGLSVVPTPPNKPIAREDKEDKVYKTAREKFQAILDEIITLSSKGRPVLVGTASVEVSELVSKMLSLRKVKHQILNAKHHKKEAEIIANAGLSGAVTIATNMAGRGTDIKLTEESKQAGGLAIIGTERHESRRIDRQLRGRAGRQGDPGSSQFFLSLEDNLMRLFGSERIAAIMDRLGLQEGEVIQHSMVSKSIARAQKKVEQNNFAIRKRLLEYDKEMGTHRNAVYKLRNLALKGKEVELDIMYMLHDTISSVIDNQADLQDTEHIKNIFKEMFGYIDDIPNYCFDESKPSSTANHIYHHLVSLFYQYFDQLQERLWEQFGGIKNDNVAMIRVPFSNGKTTITATANSSDFVQTHGRILIEELMRSTILYFIDLHWKDHLRHMDDLKQVSQNAIYERQDPIITFRFEAYNLFKKLMATINQEITSFLFQVLSSNK